MMKSFFLACSLFLLTACGTSFQLNGTPKAPGADGKVEVEKTEDGSNYMLNLMIEHLPPANRLDESKKMFMVWLTTESNAPTKLGKLAYDKDERTGNLTATTTEKQFILRITAEETSDVTAPSDFIVMQQEMTLD